MTAFTLTVEGMQPFVGDLELELAAPLLQLYRQPHDIELYDNLDDRRFMGPGIWKPSNNRDNAEIAPIPEVFRVFPDQTTPLYDWAIRMWREMNDWMSDEQFVLLLDNHWMLSNRTGWPGRRNIIYGVDLTKGWPTFHAPVINGGMLLKGREVGQDLELENIRYNVPVTAAYVLARPWLWFYAVSVTSTGQANMISRRDQRTGEMKPIKIPFITKEAPRLPLSYLHKLEPGYVPNIPHVNVNKFALANGRVEGVLNR